MSIEKKKLINISKSLMLENATYNNLTTDIGQIKYVTQDHIKKGGRSILRKMFCDNCVFIKIFDAKHTRPKGDSKNPFKNGHSMTKVELLELIQAEMKLILNRDKEEFEFEDKIVCSLPFKFQQSFLSNTRNKDSMKIRAYIEANNISDPVYTNVKVGFDSHDLDDVLECISTNADEFNKRGIFLHDFDVTEDFTGIFDREQLIRYLVQNEGYRMQTGALPKDYENHIIMEKTSTSGINCLSIIHGNLRIKLYNKFIAQVTSVGTNASFGSLIYSYISPDEKRNKYLHKLFTNEDFLRDGCTRLEITFYCMNIQLSFSDTKIEKYDLNAIPYYDVFDEDTLYDVWDRYVGMIWEPDFPLYCVPVSDMWTRIISSLKNNMCIYYPNEKECHICLYANKLTSKVIGWNIRLARYSSAKTEDVMEFVKSNYSLNSLPFYFITIENRNNPNFYKLEIFLKEGPTYFTKPNNLFSVYEKDLSTRGLVPTDNCIPALYKSGVKPHHKEIRNKVLLIPNYENKKLFYNLVNNKTREEDYLIQRKMDELSMDIYFDRYNEIMKEKKNEVRLMERFTSSLKKSFDDNRTTEVELNKEKNLVAFAISNLRKFDRVSFITDEQDLEEDLKFEATGDLKKKLLSLSKVPDISVLKRREYNIFYYIDKDYKLLPLLSFIVTHKIIDPRYRSPYFLYKIQEKVLTNKLEENPLIWDPDLKKGANTVSIDSLEGNKEYTIVKINSLPIRGKTKYIMILEGISNSYISNSFFEDAMVLDMDDEGLVKFKFQTFEMKRFERTKNKKEMALMLTY